MQSLSHQREYSGYIWWRKKTLLCCRSPSCRNAGWNQTWNGESWTEVLLLTPLWELAWYSGWAPKGWQSGVIIRIHKRETRTNAIITGTYLFLTSVENCTLSALKKSCVKLNQSWMIPRAVFVPTVALQTKFSISSKFSRNLGVPGERRISVSNGFLVADIKQLKRSHKTRKFTVSNDTTTVLKIMLLHKMLLQNRKSLLLSLITWWGEFHNGWNQILRLKRVNRWRGNSCLMTSNCKPVRLVGTGRNGN